MIVGVGLKFVRVQMAYLKVLGSAKFEVAVEVSAFSNSQ